MTNIIDLSGQKFGRLLVLKQYGRRGSKISWLCKCDCGNEKVITGNALKKGTTRSCGCYQKECVRNNMTIHGQTVTNQSSEYISWACIKTRCYNKNTLDYKNYGGRGIKVCNRWLNSFTNFYFDMGNKPSAKHSIDRIDNNGDYEPKNCRWASTKQQARNKSNNIFITYNGKVMVLNDWFKHLKMERSSYIYWTKKDKSFDWIYNRFYNKRIRNDNNNTQ